MQVTQDVIAAIGNTPLIRLKRASELTGCEILGKAEFLNPGQSVKDRAALFDAKLITTEKDYARLDPAAREGIAVFAIRAEFEDPAALVALLDRLQVAEPSQG